MRYFDLNMADERRWNLAIEDYWPDGSEVDMWAYSRCREIANPKPVPFSVYVKGTPVDYNPTAFGATVVSKRLGDLLSSIASDAIQRIPALVPAEGEWEVLNILSCVDCIDHERSIIQYCLPNDPERPNKPRGIIKLVIDPAQAAGHHIFRPKDWLVAEIVSESLKTLLERNGITGIEYWPVTME